MATVHDIANYLRAKAEQGEGEYHKVSNLKLQKLVYYVQGFHLVLLGRPAFPERIEAWLYGPAVPELYHDLKQYGNAQVPAVVPLEEVGIDEESAELIDEVFENYAKHSAWQLRNLTHEESPWIDNYDSQMGAQEISFRDLKEFFPSLLQ